MARLVADSLVSDVLELSDSQREKIKKRSDKLARKIEEFIHESRQEAFDIIAEELEEKQLETLHSFYDESRLKKQVSETPISDLYAQYLFTRPEDHDEKYSPLLYIMTTKLRDKDKR